MYILHASLWYSLVPSYVRSAFDTPSKWSSAWAITIGYDQCHILLLSNIKLRLIHAARRVISTCIQLLIGNSHCLLCTYDAEGFGAWDDRSCRVLEENDTDVECGCDHLTHFAILLVRNSVLLVEHFLLFIAPLKVLYSVLCR